MLEKKHINPLDLDADIAIGIKLPFTRKDGKLFETSYTTYDQSVTNFRSLLLTRKGERILQPRFGTDIYNSIFEPNTEETYSKLKRSIEKSVEYWLPYIEILDLDINRNQDSTLGMNGNAMYIKIQYKVTGEDVNREILLFSDETGVRIL